MKDGQDPPNGQAPRPGAADAPPPILFALPDAVVPNESLRRALSIAHARGTRLEVLRVIGAGTRPRLWPRPPRDDATRSAVVTLRALLATRRWVADVTGEEPAVGQVRIRLGDLAAQAAARAAEIGASLIVVPPLDRGGKLVTNLAHRTSVAVLVAAVAPTGGAAPEGVGQAPGETRGGVLVATKLDHRGYPLLHEGVELSRHLAAPLVALHTVGPDHPVGFLSGRLAFGGAAHGSCAARRTRLESVSRELPVDVEAVVLSEPNPVRAILREARARASDVIVVGTRPRSWLGRLAFGCVATTVVNQACASVLVAPLAAPERLSREP